MSTNDILSADDDILRQLRIMLDVLETPMADNASLSEYFIKKRVLKEHAPELVDFLSILSIYAAERTTPSDNARIHGFAHAHTVAEAVQQHEMWTRNLKGAFSKVPQAKRDYDTMREAAIRNASGLEKRPDMEKYISMALDIAFGRLPVPESKGAALNIGFDAYGDADQPKLSEWEVKSSLHLKL